MARPSVIVVRVAALALVTSIMGGCGQGDVTSPAPSRRSLVLAAGDIGVVYVQSNDPTPGKNSVLAYARGANGSLTPLPGSPFLTGGTGVGNPMQVLGPQDVDQNIWPDRGRRLLFVVN